MNAGMVPQKVPWCTMHEEVGWGVFEVNVGGFVVVVLPRVDFDVVVIGFKVVVGFVVVVAFEVVDVVEVVDTLEVVDEVAEVAEDEVCEIGAPCPVPGIRYQFSSGS